MAFVYLATRVSRRCWAMHGTFDAWLSHHLLRHGHSPWVGVDRPVNGALGGAGAIGLPLQALPHPWWVAYWPAAGIASAAATGIRSAADMATAGATPVSGGGAPRSASAPAEDSPATLTVEEHLMRFEDARRVNHGETGDFTPSPSD